MKSTRRARKCASFRRKRASFFAKFSANAQVFGANAQVRLASRAKVGINRQEIRKNAQVLSGNFKKRSLFGHVFATPLRKCARVTTVAREP
jgi:hypothetical protein